MIYFSEYAWAKLCWFRNNCNENNVGNTVYAKPSFLEVSLMGISKSEEEINFIVDFVCVPQEASGGLTEPTDEGMLKYGEDMMIDRGLPTTMFRAFWAHTHPGTCPKPSGTDQETFSKWFKDSDIGVMYIMADGDDSCTVKNQSKYFGAKTEQMPTYVVFNREVAEGGAYWISTKTMFSINKLGVNEGYSDLSFLMMEDYSSYHESWMQELKDNVKKKSYTNTTTVGIYDPYHAQRNNQQIQSTFGEQTKKEKAGEEKQEKQEQKGKAKVYGLKAESLIEIMIKYNKESINAFTLVDRKKICDVFNITLGDLQSVYNRIKLFEDSFSIENLMPWEKEILTLDGKSNYENLTQKQLIEICKDLLIRPIRLKDVIKIYIDKAFAPFGL